MRLLSYYCKGIVIEILTLWPTTPDTIHVRLGTFTLSTFSPSKVQTFTIALIKLSFCNYSKISFIRLESCKIWSLDSSHMFTPQDHRSSPTPIFNMPNFITWGETTLFMPKDLTLWNLRWGALLEVLEEAAAANWPCTVILRADIALQLLN